MTTCLFKRSEVITHFLVFILFFIGSISVIAQEDDYLESINASYDDALHTWELYTNQQEGTLEMTWINKHDLSEWNYELGEYSGIIRTVWPGKFDKWELRSFEGNNIQFSIKWRGDKTEWLITDGDTQLTYRTIRGADLNAWEIVKNKQVGEYRMYTEFDDDPRDWIVEDYLVEDLPIEFTLVCSFIPVYVIMTL